MKVIITVDGEQSGKEFLDKLGYQDVVIEKQNNWSSDWVGEFTLTGSELVQFVKTTMVDKIINNPVVYSVEIINDE